MVFIRRWIYILSVIFIIALFLSGCAAGDKDSGGVSSHGQLTVADGVLTDKNGEQFQLRGMSTHGIAWYPEYINEEAFLSVKDAGGNVIRAAMYTDTENGYLADAQNNIELVVKAIEIAKSLDMYVIVDWHILSDGDPSANQDAAIEFFEEIAGRYAKDPAVIYEICNEPNGVEWNTIKEYANAVFPVIRAHSPNAVIILGTPHYSTDLREAVLQPFSEENFMYAYHFYEGQHTSYSILEYVAEHNVPVMVSEWGINYDENGTPALEAGSEFVDYLNKNKISWCAWSLCNKDEIFSVLKADCEKYGGWSDEDLTDVGSIIFNAL